MFFHTRSCTTCWYVSIFKELFFNCYRVFSIAGAKVRSFFILPKLFESFFSEKKFSVKNGAFLNSPPNYPPLRQYTWLTTPSSLDCGCKDNALKHIYPNFLTGFFELFYPNTPKWMKILFRYARVYKKRKRINVWMEHTLFTEWQAHRYNYTIPFFLATLRKFSSLMRKEKKLFEEGV